MPAPIEASENNLAPIPGKHHFSLTREWREELIHFLLIDRFATASLARPLCSRAALAGSARRTTPTAAAPKIVCDDLK